MEARRDVFQAIADPTRRAIIGRIAQEPVNINSIAEQFKISRQAISLQLKILEECGLLQVKQQGRERICVAKLEKLNEVQEWVKQHQKIWTSRLQALKRFVEQEELQPKSSLKYSSKSKLKNNGK